MPISALRPQVAASGGRRDDHYNVYDNRNEALNEVLHMNDPRYPPQFRQNKAFKYYYQTQGPTTTKHRQ